MPAELEIVRRSGNEFEIGLFNVFQFFVFEANFTLFNVGHGIKFRRRFPAGNWGKYNSIEIEFGFKTIDNLLFNLFLASTAGIAEANFQRSFANKNAGQPINGILLIDIQQKHLFDEFARRENFFDVRAAATGDPFLIDVALQFCGEQLCPRIIQTAAVPRHKQPVFYREVFVIPLQ